MPTARMGGTKTSPEIQQQLVTLDERIADVRALRLDLTAAIESLKDIIEQTATLRTTSR